MEFARRYGPWAVVTGASDGIGRAFAAASARRGLNVLLAARRRDRLDGLARELSAAHGVACESVACDLGREEGVAALLERAAELDSGLLVSAAGFGTSGLFHASALDQELDMLAVNCAATLRLSRWFAERFAARGSGGLVLMGSLLGFQGVPGAAHYAATKAYVQTLAEGLRGELAASGVDVVACAPGPVLSGFGARARMAMTLGDEPQAVAEGALSRLRGGGTVRPGSVSKILGWSLLPLPRAARSAILAKVMSRMALPKTRAA